MAEYKIQLGVDIRTSQIREQISRYNTNSNNAKLRLGVRLDTRGISEQIRNINSRTPVRINVQLNTQNLNTQINNIRRQLQRLGNININLGGRGGIGGGAAAGANDVNRAYRELISLQNRLASKQQRLANIDTSINSEKNQREILALTRQIDNLHDRYQRLRSLFNGQFSAAQVDNLNRKFQVTSEKLEQVNRKSADARANLAQGFRGNFGNYENQILSLEQRFSQLTNKSQTVRTGIDAVRQALAAMRAAGGDDTALIAAEERYQRELKETEAQLKRNENAQRQRNKDTTLDLAKKNLTSDIDNWLKNNDAAAKQFGARLDDIKRRINSCDAETLKHLRAEFQGVKKEAELTGKATQTFASKMKAQFSKYSSYFSVMSLFMYGRMAITDMFRQVVAIDTAMTELKKVTDETSEAYDNFLTNAASRAKEIGTTIDGLVQSTAGFARLGYGFEESQGLAEVANIYAVVGDQVDGVEGATQSLISTMAAFREQANGMASDDFALSIVDKFNEIGNNFAISSGGIGEAMKRSASSMAAANNTLDETIALITAANTVVQNPEKVGNAFKTVSMRIRGAKTELEEAGESTDGMASSTAKLRQEILALSGVDIMLDSDTFKSTYQILEELSGKWGELSDIAQASITELIAGKHQGNVIASLMTNFDIAQEALQTSLNSSGSAMKEHEKWQQSLQARINTLKAAWQSLAQTFMKSDFLSGLLKFVTKLVEGLDELIGTFGTIPTILGSIVAYKSVFKWLPKIFSTATAVGGISRLADVLPLLSLTFPKAAAGAAKFASALKSVGISLAGLAIANPILAATAIAIGAVAAVFAVKAIKAKKLAENVEELTGKYREQHKELKELEDDFDTDNADSMISKYDRLSKGVDAFGKNVSLTADEYEEYQGIVNQIADQIPSLISGYDEHGNAILSCKGNVDQLIEAYERLIHIQNQEILTNVGDIENDFENTLQKASGKDWWSDGHGIWAGLLNNGFAGTAGVLGSDSLDYELKDDTIKYIESLMNAVDESERAAALTMLERDRYSKKELRDALTSAGIDIGTFESPVDVLLEQLDEDPSKVRNIIDDYYAQFTEAVEEQKSIATAKLSEAFDVSSVISGLNYGNISEELQAIAYQTINSFDWEFLSELKESGISVEQWTTEMLDQLNAISEADNIKLEAAFDLQTQFNSGNVTLGEFVSGLSDAQSLINSLNLKDEAKEQLEITLGLNEGGFVDQYEAMVNRLTDSSNYDFKISDKEAREWLSGLTAEEYPIALEIITETSDNNVYETISDLQGMLEREMALLGLSLDLDITYEKSQVDKLKNVITEAISGSGLTVDISGEETVDSLRVITEMYGELASYDPSKLFERTANGIRLNSDELRKLNAEYRDTKLAETSKQLDTLGDIYNQTREELYNLTYGTQEYYDKAAELRSIEEQINATETLAAQYRGLSSAYQEWQNMEAAGSQRDMYEKVIEGLEGIDDEISRGWYDDATIEFLELLTGRDLSTSGIDEITEAYRSLNETIGDTSYRIRDFFTVDSDGNSTNKGVYNFLRAIEGLTAEDFRSIEGINLEGLGDGLFENDIIQRDQTTGDIIGFDFGVVGGDEVIAEALGISEELVQIMVRAADDAGFVVSMDGTFQQLDVLKEKAQEASIIMNQILSGDNKATIDIDMNADSVEEIQPQIDNIMEAFGERDASGNLTGAIDMSVNGAEEALTVASTLQSMLDRVEEPAYMNLELSDVEDSLREPLRLFQSLRDLEKTENQLVLSGADTSQLEADIEEIYAEIEGLPDETKIEIGLVDDNNNPLTGDALRGKIDDILSGNSELGITATVDIQMEMDNKLGILVDKALLDAGLIDKDEFNQRVQIYLDADVNNEDAKTEVANSVNEVTGNSNGESSDAGSSETVEKSVDVEITANEVKTESFWDKIKNWFTGGGSDTDATAGSTEVKTDISIEAGDVDISDVSNEISEALQEASNKTYELETTIEEAASMMDSFEDKDITIDVTVNGLDDVKELSKNISIATEIDGNVEKLSEYVESAKALSELEDNTYTSITANIYGNVTDLEDSKINKLKTVADSHEQLSGLKDIGSFNVEIDADVDAEVNGNLSEVSADTISKISDLADEVKHVENLGISSDIELGADINLDGNITEKDNSSLENISKFGSEIRKISDLNKEDVSLKVTADIQGNVIEKDSESFAKLGEFKTEFDKLGSKSESKSLTVTADIQGNAIAKDSDQIAKLGEFKTAFEDLGTASGVKSLTVKADIQGTAIEKSEDDFAKISALKKEYENLKGVSGVRSLVINADIQGTAIEKSEDDFAKLDIFKEKFESYNKVQGAYKSLELNANVKGNVIENDSDPLSKLDTFKDTFEAINAIEEDVTSLTVNANVRGNILGEDSSALSNLTALRTQIDNIKAISGADVSLKAEANLDGSIVNYDKNQISNLSTFGNSIREIQDLDNTNVYVTATADIGGNVVEQDTASLLNIGTFKSQVKSLAEIKDIGNITVLAEANAEGSVVRELSVPQIEKIGTFAGIIKDNADLGKTNLTLTAYANIEGNGIASSNVENFGEYIDNVNDLSGLSDVERNVYANAYGNAIDPSTSEDRLSSLSEFKTIAAGLQSESIAISVTANVDSENVNNAIDTLTNIANTGIFKDYNATLTLGARVTTIDASIVDQYISEKKTANGEVKWANVETEINDFKSKIHEATGEVKWINNITSVQKHFKATGTVTWTSGNNVQVKVIKLAKGTAYANGSVSGSAYAQGNWGIKGNGVALGGELGQELVVRNGRFFTIGDNGAEFFRYKKNDIVFNAAQTESLFKYGGIKGANPRGKAIATGSAFASGLAFANNSEGNISHSTEVNSGTSVNTSNYSSSGRKSSSKNSSNNSNSSNDAEEFKETLDWIETAIDRIERAIDSLDKKAGNVYKSWSDRNSALTSEISKVGEEINLQQKAYNRYMQEANSVGLSSDWAKKIQNGKVDIESITDEDLADKIKQYQDWYEKALDCKDSIEELKETEAELYMQRFENVSAQYDGILGVIEHEKNMLEEYINQSEAQSWLVSSEYYNALLDNENKNIEQLKKEKAAMITEFNNAVSSGKITEGSEAWYEMVASIDEVSETIAESETALLEYKQTLQQLSWEKFDILQDKISAITEESEFLVELLSSDKLHDDNGQLTDSGMATMGQHGSAYNTYMYQADLAADEAERLKKELEKDPYDTELEERYREMVALQREHILAAQDEKEAIRDLVEEGINLELEALQEKIDKYEEALESQKDLFDYQKKVKEQTEEIASLEKQMAAYAGDDSEEARQKIQQIKVSLEEARDELQETEYDKIINDTSTMLDNLYEEYETILNTRLDNLDALVSDMITEINTDAAMISNTLSEKADSVGYRLSDSMKTIWDSNTVTTTNVITTYGEKFSTAQTTTNNALNTINSNMQKMITQLNSIAKTNVQSASTSSASNKNDTASGGNTTGGSSSGNTGNKPATTTPTTTNNNTIKVGGKINAGSAPIYDYAGDTSGERQLYRNDPIYTVISEKNGYLLTRWHKLSSGYTGWFKKTDVKAYATGKKNFLGNEVAWTQDGGQEFIVRPSDGAILTPIARGDSVLSANASRNIWNMANSPSEFIRDNLSIGSSNIPNNSNAQNNYTQHLDKVVFNLPNVKNYDELLSAMQKDKNFENLILSISIDRLAGKSSLAKGKSIR